MQTTLVEVYHVGKELLHRPVLSSSDWCLRWSRVPIQHLVGCQNLDPFTELCWDSFRCRQKVGIYTYIVISGMAFYL